MKVTTTNMKTEVIFSDDAKKRYLLHKEWDADKPQIAIIMIAPSDADGISLDKTTLQVLNNTFRLGYGGVYILNMFSTMNDFTLKSAEPEDAENLQMIQMVLDKVDIVIYAPGVGIVSNQTFIERQKQIIKTLQAHEGKLRCLCDSEGKSRLQHPLSPAVREWHLSRVSVKEILAERIKTKPDKKAKKNIQNKN